jgi:hypothetical protein
MPSEITQGMVADDEPRSLSERLARVEMLLTGFSKEFIFSPNSSGTMNRYEVLAATVGSDASMQAALSPYFETTDGTLYGLVAPHAMLSPDHGEIFRPIVPTLAGVPVDAENPPKVILSPGKWYLLLKGGHGVASVQYTKDLPERQDRMPGADWVILAEFDVEGITVKNLRRHNTAWQHGLRRPDGFAPLLWRDGNTWKAKLVGHVIDRSRMVKIKTEWTGTVAEGDRLFRRLKTGADGELLACDIIQVNQSGETPKDEFHLPLLSDQKGKPGVYHVPLCRITRTDDAGKDDKNNDIFTLYPEMYLSGDLVWQPESFENIGVGDGKLLKSTSLSPRKLRVRSIKNGDLNQIQVVQLANEVMVRGNGKTGQLIWQSCEGYDTVLLEWIDGLIVTEGAATFKAGCSTTTTDAPGP